MKPVFAIYPGGSPTLSSAPVDPLVEGHADIDVANRLAGDLADRVGIAVTLVHEDLKHRLLVLPSRVLPHPIAVTGWSP